MTNISNTQRTLLAAAIEHTHGRIERFPQGLSGSALVISLEALERKGLANHNDQGHWWVTLDGYRIMGHEPPADLVEAEAIAAAAQAHEATAHEALVAAALEPEVTAEPNAPVAAPEATDAAEASEPEATVPEGAAEPDAPFATPESVDAAESEAASEPDTAIKPKQIKVCPHCGHALTTPVTRTRENSRPRENSKQDLVVQLLKRPEGATIEQMMATTGWQQHTVRGTLAGALKKKLGLTITSKKVDGLRAYHAE